DYMAIWLDDHRDDFLRLSLEREAPPDPVVCAQCQGSTIDKELFRCSSCFGRPVYCADCMRSKHDRDPFHRIERWSGKYFEDAWLKDVGLVLHLGHQGHACPKGKVEEPVETKEDHSDKEEEPDDIQTGRFRQSKPSGSKARMSCIVDVTGVHELPVMYCQCIPAVPHAHQAVALDLWPASFKRIKTLFTFRLLSDFRMDNLETKATAWSYFQKLRRVTNPAFPDGVPNRYPELRRVARQWRNILYRKWFGFGHEPRTPKQGEMALFCPACPQPGVNLPERWEEDKGNIIYIRQFAMDGNFSASHFKQVRNNDVSLTNGECYMTEEKTYKEYLAEYEGPEAIELECHNHRAVLDKNKAKTGKDITGIGATACAQHGCFCPSSVVDFEKGERYSYMDWSLSEALQTTHVASLTCGINNYDVNCAYCKHLRARFASNERLYWPDNFQVQPAIGLLHVHGHKEECMGRYAGSYIIGNGRTDGEIVESLWASLNDTSRSTQSASLPYRRETLDDSMGDSNWKKWLGIGEFSYTTEI
ncbi:hypothetical protein BDN72DRAFT_782554, partial [Pluteus cervinus]